MVERHRIVPDPIRDRDSLDRPHYVDYFTMPAPEHMQAAASPTDWARAVCTLTPAAVAVWRGVLGLRLHPGAPDHIGGWRIGAETESWTRVEAESWLLDAHVVFGLESNELSLATFVHYESPAAKLVWPPVAAVHQRSVPIMMRQGAKTLATAGGSAA
jgi:hypothetical protein